MRRDLMIRALAEAIDAVAVSRPLRVAVDGPDAAGKTTLGDEVAVALQVIGREVVRASVNGFHRPRAERYAKGAGSPAGYFDDSFDHAALLRVLLDPFGPEGTRRYRTRVFDFETDRPVDEAERVAGERTVLIVDGVFLLRRELNDAWDYRVFVAATVDETLRRAVERDAALPGHADAVRERYRERYIPAQELYLDTVRPLELADVIVDNADPANPAVTFRE